MKRAVFGVIASAMLVLLNVGFAAAQNRTFTGEIMDSQCAAMGSHEMMEKKAGLHSAKDCTLACVKMGGKFVLYNAASKAVYQLDDQSKPEEFAGQKVSVTGTYNRATKTIHVADIKSGS